VRIKRIVAGLAALAAVTGIAACSSGTSTNSAGIAVAAATSSTTPSTSEQTTTVAPPPTTTTTTTTTVAPTTTPPPVTKPPVAQPAAQTVATTSQTPCSAAARACVDLSAHKAWLVQDGKIVYGPVSIMPGRPGWRTPVGTFHVQFKDATFYSTEFHAPMPYSVFFVGGVAFHEGSLSTPSHGCVHLSESSAITFFRTLSVGDEVQVVS